MKEVEKIEKKGMGKGGIGVKEEGSEKAKKPEEGENRKAMRGNTVEC